MFITGGSTKKKYLELSVLTIIPSCLISLYFTIISNDFKCFKIKPTKMADSKLHLGLVWLWLSTLKLFGLNVPLAFCPKIGFQWIVSIHWVLSHENQDLKSNLAFIGNWFLWEKNIRWILNAVASSPSLSLSLSSLHSHSLSLTHTHSVYLSTLYM